MYESMVRVNTVMNDCDSDGSKSTSDTSNHICFTPTEIIWQIVTEFNCLSLLQMLKTPAKKEDPSAPVEHFSN